MISLVRSQAPKAYRWIDISQAVRCVVFWRKIMHNPTYAQVQNGGYLSTVFNKYLLYAIKADITETIRAHMLTVKLRLSHKISLCIFFIDILNY